MEFTLKIIIHSRQNSVSMINLYFISTKHFNTSSLAICDLKTNNKINSCSVSGVYN